MQKRSSEPKRRLSSDEKEPEAEVKDEIESDDETSREKKRRKKKKKVCVLLYGFLSFLVDIKNMVD